MQLNNPCTISPRGKLKNRVASLYTTIIGKVYVLLSTMKSHPSKINMYLTPSNTLLSYKPFYARQLLPSSHILFSPM